MQDMDSLKFIT